MFRVFLLHSTYMKLTIAELAHLANLARLSLTEEERERFAGELSSILGYVEKLETANTDTVEPTSHAAGVENALREDRVSKFAHREDLLRQVPKKREGLVQVPAVFEE